jgi:hypothetical protein
MRSGYSIYRSESVISRYLLAAVLCVPVSVSAAAEDGDESHWAFRVPQRPDIPAVAQPELCRNPIDHFVHGRLEREGLEPSKEADRYTLIRRLSLDLTGLPPSIDEVDRFVADDAPDAYDRLVDRLLSSPPYGERWALWWLDAARYADTNGYEIDRPRSMWPYRDWVINAFNRDLPFDRFTIEQIAGDMLPQPSIDQRVATGFNRNSFMNEEGGHDWEQFRYESIVDRVQTTATVFLGLTLACARCHDHKYDPILQREYYEFFALLNNDDEPELAVLDPEILKRQADVDNKIARLEVERAERLPDDWERNFHAWCDEQSNQSTRWTLLKPAHVVSQNNATMTKLSDGSLLVTGDRPELDRYEIDCETDIERITGFRLEAIPDPRLPHHGPGRGSVMDDGTFVVTEFDVRAFPNKSDAAVPLRFARADSTFHHGERTAEKAIDGNRLTSWHIQGGAGKKHVAVFQLERPYECSGDTRLNITISQNFVHQQTLGRFRMYVTGDMAELPARLRSTTVDEILLCNPKARTAQQRRELKVHYLSVAPELSEFNTAIETLRESRPRLPTTLVMAERREPRTTHLHIRGDFRRPGIAVTGNVPAVLPPISAGQSPDRLSLAEWVVDERNPLTARVIMNQLWQQYFGLGIVITPEDFGTQGELPSHPQLLDWLSTEFQRQKWSLKAAHRLIVTSAVYRQSASATAELRSKDPENVLLARAPRHRLEPERIRDVLLMVSGLLDHRLGGPSVFPSQPAAAASSFHFTWTESAGSDKFRRGLYTFRRRTAPYAMFSLFDAPTGNICSVHRHRSNTPLQALALLNDDLTLAAARALAVRVVQLDAGDLESRARLAFRACVTRPPDTVEMNQLLAFYQRQHKRLVAGELNAAEITGTQRVPAGDTLEDLAVWTMVARLLLNLDETITKE